MTLREMSDTLKATDPTPFIPEWMFMHRDVRSWGGVFSGSPFPQRHPDTNLVIVHEGDGKSWWYLTIRDNRRGEVVTMYQTRAADKREALEKFHARFIDGVEGEVRPS